jgi:hypothetical protein
MVDYVILTMYGSRSEQANRLSRSYVTPRLPLVCNQTLSSGCQLMDSMRSLLVNSTLQDCHREH